jgi:hypothetical protein
MSATIVGLPATGFCPNNESIADWLRGLANQLEHPDAEAVDSLTFVIEYSAGYLETDSCGKPTDRARMVGIMAIALNQLITYRAPVEEGE